MTTKKFLLVNHRSDGKTQDNPSVAKVWAAKKASYTAEGYRTTEYTIDYHPDPGRQSEKGERLAEFCLGRYANQAIPSFNADDSYLEKPRRVWCETRKKRLYLRVPQSARKPNKAVKEQKQIVPAWISQSADFPDGFNCFIISGDKPDPGTDPQLGAHVGICRPPEVDHIILVPGSNRDRVLGGMLYEQLENLRRHHVPWSEKTDTAWWGGATSGSASESPKVLNRFRFLTWLQQNPTPRINVDMVKSGKKWASEYALPQPCGGFSKAKAFSNKCLVLLKGNDVASGLSWFFCGNSVVLMQPPMLEHILTFEMQPWVHYVPLEPDPEDILVKLDWVLSHEKAAQEIVRNAHRHLYWLTGAEYQWACNEVLRRIAQG